MARPDEELLERAFESLDTAIRAVVGTNGPLIPFAAILAADGEVSLIAFQSGRTPEEARQQARAHVASTVNCVLYTIAADGGITENGTRYPVVMIECGRRGDAHGFSFVQRFASTPQAKFAEPIRNPSIIDQPPILGPALG